MKAYLVFSQTGTIPSRLIQYCTKDPYNHTSISFDLVTMYSFARLYKYSWCPAGFIEEHFETGVFAMHPFAKIAICEVELNDPMRKLEIARTSPGYNYLGLAVDRFGVRHETNRMYCSQFANLMTEDFDQTMVTPGMLFEKHKKDLIYQGTIADFLTKRSKYIPRNLSTAL